jgi:cellulose synthase/poly-beta-1,6-N-acetylglucosamine synthase-like glycosyltransferase
METHEQAERMAPSVSPTDAYIAAAAILSVYGLHRLSFLMRFRWHEAQETRLERDKQAELPVVTVQLPLFNERTVAARLIAAVGRLDYPRERLEIQVLDDSTDETRDVVEREVLELRRRGIDAKVLRRADRHGFKAGALDHGMRHARGELLCVFDADFLAPESFLRDLVSYFADPRVGMVQARWEHLNRDESALTRAQSTLLDGHFVIEHKVRFDHGLFFNFNGTAGLWRRETIQSAGGWQHDTLTEDLDLSYRAQLRGWRFIYAPGVTAPAEVPADISAFKSQQHRWAKGSVQVARKLGRTILTAKLPLAVKLEAAAHLAGNSGYPFVLLLAILYPFSLVAGVETRADLRSAIFALALLAVFLFYDRSQRAVRRSWQARLIDVPAAIALGIGMCVSQTSAVLSGFRRGSGAFVRTPKRGNQPSARPYRVPLHGMGLWEFALAAWLCFALVRAVRLELWGSLPFLVLASSGCLWVGALSLGAWWRTRQGSRAPLRFERAIARES